MEAYVASKICKIDTLKSEKKNRVLGVGEYLSLLLRASMLFKLLPDTSDSDRYGAIMRGRSTFICR